MRISDWSSDVCSSDLGVQPSGWIVFAPLMCGIPYSPPDCGSPMFGVSADLPSAKTRDVETRTEHYDQIEWKDRRHHRWRHRHRPRDRKALHRDRKRVG